MDQNNWTATGNSDINNNSHTFQLFLPSSIGGMAQIPPSGGHPKIPAPRGLGDGYFRVSSEELYLSHPAYTTPRMPGIKYPWEALKYQLNPPRPQRQGRYYQLDKALP